MKLKTSFFNGALLRKDIARFAPAWALFSAYLLLVFTGSVLTDNQSSMASMLGDSIIGFSFGSLVYAMLCAQLLFGDLFQSRMCNALHALPIRREGWFATHVLAGWLFFAVPVVAVGLFFLSLLGRFYMAALLWMSALLLQFFFFYAVAVLSIMLVGNRFAAIVVYGILNFLSAIGLWLFTFLYQPHLYGFVINETEFLRFCPMVWMMQCSWFTTNGVTGRVLLQDGWGYLGICTAVGAVLLAGALLLYRRRPLEKAGDFIVFKPTEPVFLVLYTFSAGTAMHLFSEIFVGGDAEFLFLLVGLAIGFFTGLMLLKRTVRVFRGRAFAGFGILMAVFGLTLLATVLDPLGVTGWVPEQAQIQRVYVGHNYRYEKDDHAFDASNQDVVRDVLSLHQYAIDHPDAGTNGVSDTRITFYYELTDGRTVLREYYFDLGTPAVDTLKHVLSQPEMVFGSQFTTLEAFQDALSQLEVTYPRYSDDQFVLSAGGQAKKVKQLAEAIYTDALEGNLSQYWPFTEGHSNELDLRLYRRDGNVTAAYRESWYITINEDCVNTMPLIEEWIYEETH